MSCLALPCLHTVRVSVSCMYSRRYLQSTYRSAVMLVQPTNDPVPFPPRLDNRPTREADAQQQPQINTLRPAYTACTSIRRSTMVDSLGPLLLAPAHALPRSRSNDRQAARLFGTPPPHVSSLSPRSVERLVHPSSASTRRCTMSTSLLPPASLSWQWRWLVPRGRHGGGSGSTGMQPIPR